MVRTRSTNISLHSKIQGLRSSAFGLKSRNQTSKKLEKQTLSSDKKLQETWYKGDGPTGCPLGYRELVVPSTKLPGVKQGRDSVGMLTWYRADLTHSIKLVKTGTFYIWREINKEILNRQKCPPACYLYPPTRFPIH